MMHVAVCADGIYPAQVGGVQRHTRLLVEHLAMRHPDVRLTVIHSDPERRFFAELPSVEEIAVAPRPGRRTYVVECWELSARIAAELRKIPEAVVYSQGIAVLSSVREFTHRLVVNPHGLESLQAPSLRDRVLATPFRMAIKHAMRNARFVVSLGGSLTDILRRCVPHERIVVLPNGVVMPGEVPARHRDPSEPLRVLFVGRFASNKGIPDLIEAARRLLRHEPGSVFRFDLVGEGPMLAQLRSETDLPRVTFHGKVDDAALEHLYAAADVFVLPTLFEGMPTVVLEAMARGLPILVTDVGATRELVDATNGQIIPKRDPASIAAALLQFRNLDPASLRDLGAASVRKVEERFTWDRVADAHVELFGRLSSRKP